MKLDTFLNPATQLSQIAETARAAEEIGFHTIWVAETQHNPFLPCTLIAEHTQRVEIGTAIAVSFARSPAVMAHTAWDLAELSGGRFILGLGTQVKAHIVRRFGMQWPESPVGKQREQIGGIRAFWDTWQNNAKLNQRGQYYKLTLSSPFFTPARIEHPEIPIYIAGVNTGLARLAGETANGFHVHPFHSTRYLKEVMLPAIQAGAEAQARTLADVDMAVNAFTITNESERAFARQQLSFYASTPSYRSVMRLHGWEEEAEKLSEMASRQQWAEMIDLITDEMLAEFATIADTADLAAALKERYAGIANRITVYVPFVPGERDDFWKQVVAGFQD
ncbi:MAG: TIGR03617 family F420-dependent LLM class oxidoreductase [Chloroflexi bacterium]|nr:MAG: TIGR03617 family F420-dependent LLM class oxidoreductase [Chloroflexota bacterium]MBL1193236.1 TIGR03617 family F420-dependent LLM class oxidoreductase [Chloroflexota bacterium]NOH10531.1 TIGR03617 family F420-dependent LLM class oxidoreductase [Chloroflexota bacterium]